MTTPTPTTTKRPRAPSSPSPASTTASIDPPSKASRILPYSSYDTPATANSSGPGSTVKQGGSTASVSTHPLLCNLPPTCQRHPTPIANTAELERHYATYHAHVCEEKGCGSVFPDGRLLELHQTECHDPIAALNKERGQKIFQCHLPPPTCGRFFMTPKARRLHLIQAHSFPKEFFFAVTNKGIGGLLKKWGEGASMVRKEWKPRAGHDEANDHPNTMSYRSDEDDKMDEDDNDDEEDDEDDNDSQEEEEEEAGDLEATPRMHPRTTGIHSPQSSISSSKGHDHNHHNQRSQHNNTNRNDHGGVDGLVNSLDSLTLVPNSIQFGRGKTGGFAPNPRGGRGRGRARGAAYPAVRGGPPPAAAGHVDVDGPLARTEHVGAGNVPPTHDGIPRGRGSGRARPRGRGRGRGRGL